MSKSSFDIEGFQIVKSKKSSKKQTRLPRRDINFVKQELEVDIDTVITRIQSAVEDLRNSEYLTELSKSVSTVIKNRKVVEIVCFGLGHFAECNISRYQLALLLCLKKACEPQKVLVHDPIFYRDECDILKRLQLDVIDENNEGSYVISDEAITIAYFPHCPKQLTNNFLWSNWSANLQKCILISNSFSSLFDNQPSRIILETVPYIFKIHTYTSEIVLQNSFKYTDIFNDTSIHHFSVERIDETDFWNKGEKPNYENTEEFITSHMVEKLNI
ncbi:SRR1-like protein isoform X1 [Plodia interpunctella]|uniref:SRR1-like protein isoform X1 n=1 Tax=Plodia interpunctella TaxID=58824 RepID=UPI0023679CF7|nr:SRR1-like protein isoform X1 [Plodia interpunctella]